MALPPAHRVNHAPVLIPSADDAWDNEKIEADKAAILRGERPEWPTAADHPTSRYWNGESRYDEATISDWLKPGSEPARIVLRRIADPEDLDEIDRLVELGFNHRATTYCVRRGIAKVTGIDGLGSLVSPLTKAHDTELLERIGKEARAQVGVAIFRVSQITLTAAEKKP